jgi:hypothetical protein
MSPVAPSPARKPARRSLLAPLAAFSLLLACGGDDLERGDASDGVGSGADAAVSGGGGGDAGGSHGAMDAGAALPGSDASSGNRDAGGSASDASSAGNSDTGAGKSDAASPAPASSAAEVAAKLGRDHFLIGLGNDLAEDHDEDGAYTLGVSLDVHYAYLVGLMGQGGWTDWNEGGTFVNILTDSAKEHGTVPMFTLYSMAAWGEANAEVLTDDEYMKPYWDGAKLLFQRLGAFNAPAIVQFEPDWWAYAQQESGGNPGALAVHVTSLAPDCAGQPNTLVGMGKCLVVLARKYAPKTVIGFHASLWADDDPSQIAAFLGKIGAGETDLVFVEMLDRDAGCFEAHTDEACQRGGTTGWYWQEADFKEHLDAVTVISKALKKPLMWWQLPLGVASNTPGGTSGHYRDNRVSYVFSHIPEFVAAGGVGAVFGVGAGNQTTIQTDGGQFKRAVTKYFQAPTRF